MQRALAENNFSAFYYYSIFYEEVNIKIIFLLICLPFHLDYNMS